MSLKIEILATGVNNLERMVKAFEKASKVMTSTDDASKKLTQTEQKLVQQFNELAAAGKVSAAALAKMVNQLVTAAKAVPALEQLSKPFTRMSKDINIVRTAAAALNKELMSSSLANQDALGNKMYMRRVQNSKASIELQKRLNAEIEKQGKLKADIVTLDSKQGNTALQMQVRTLKQAIAYTEQLLTQKQRLLSTEERLAAVSARASSGRSALASGGNQAALNQDAQIIKTQIAALDKLQARLTALKGTKVLPTEQFNAFRSAIEQSKRNIDLTGQSQRELIAGVSQTVTHYEKQAASILKSQKALSQQKATLVSLAEQRQKELATTEKSLQVQKDAAIASHKAALAAQRELAIRENIAALNSQRTRNTASTAASLAAQRELAIKENIAALDRQRQAALAAQAREASRVSQIYGAQAAQIDRLKTKLQGLGKVKLEGLDASKVKTLTSDFHELSRTLATTGKLPAKQFNELNKILDALTLKLSKNASAATSWTGKLKYAVGGVARSFGAMTYSYAQLVPLLSGIALGSFVKKVYQVGAALEYTTTYVDALRTSLEGVNAGEISSSLLNFEDLRTGPKELAAGMKEFAKAGVEAAESMGQIEEMSKFATVAELELGEAVKLVVGQSRAFDQSFVETSNMIAAAALSSATDIQEMATALSYTTELAEVSRVKFHEVATAMAVMANAGIRGSKAGTAIRTSILKMQNPSEKLKKQLDALGVSWNAFTEGGQVKDLRTMFTELKAATDKLPDKQRIGVLKELFGLRALKGGANILRAQGKEWDEMAAKIKAANGELSFIEMTYGKLSDTVTAKTEVLKASYEQFAAKGSAPEWAKTMLDDLNAIVKSELLSDLRDGLIGIANFTGVGVTGTLKFFTDLYDRAKSISPVFVKLSEAMKDAASRLGEDSLLGKGASWLGDKFAYLEEKAKGFIKATMNLNKTKPFIVEQAEKSNIPFVEPPKVTQEFGPQKPSDKQLEQMEDMRIAAEFAQLQIAEFYKQVESTINTSNLSEWEKKLAEAKGEASELIAEFEKAKGVKLTPVQAKEIEDKFVGNLIAENLREVQQIVDDLNFDTMTRGLEKSESFVDKIYGGFLKVREEARKQLMDRGMVLDGEGGMFTAEGQKQFEAMLKNADLFQSKIDELAKGDDKFANIVGAIADVRGVLHAGTEDTEYWRTVLSALEDKLVTMKADGIEKVNRAIKDLQFDNMINGLKNSDDAVDRLKGGLKEMTKKAKEFLEAEGVAFDSARGKEYFKAMVEGSQMFEKAIESAEEKVRDLQNTLEDTKFGFAEDLFKERQKLGSPTKDNTKANFQYQLKQIDQLEKAAAKASTSGEDGWKRQVELLQQAYSIAKSMETSQEASAAEERMTRAKAEMEKYAGALNSMRSKTQREYQAAKAEYERAKAGGVDKGLQQRKISEMEEIQKKILEIQKIEEQKAQQELEDVKKFHEKSKKAWESVKTATEEAKKSAEQYLGVVDKTSTKVQDWANGTVQMIGKVTAAYEKMNKAAASGGNYTNEYGTDFDFDGKRAAGGPVMPGSTYLVGEKGPELFSPGSAGTIIPNNELQKTSGDSHTLNLNFNGRRVGTLRGSRQDVEASLRVFQQMQESLS